MAHLLSLTQDAEPYPGYRLHQFIGEGGFGEVWSATGPDGKPVALKFIPCNSQRAASREIRAAQSVRHLQHPNLIKIHRIWGDSGYVVVAMELAEGNLWDLFTVYEEECGTPILPGHLCHYLGQAAAALDYLNARQHLLNGRRVAVRHCDVKPSNLLVRDNVVKLSDFSLSVQTASAMWYYERVGTLNYAAPEVFQGWLSDRTDQYALAVTYCQMRTGRLPFADTPDTFDRGYVRPHPDLGRLTPPEQTVLLRALHPVPQNRWPSCAEMVRRLEAAIP